MSYATRRSFKMVPETCPMVDKAMASAKDEIQNQTMALRNALVDVIEENENLDAQVAELEFKVKALTEELEDLRAASIMEIS